MTTAERTRAVSSKELMRAFEPIVPGTVVRAWKVEASWEMRSVLGLDARSGGAGFFYLCEYRREIEGQQVLAIEVLDRDPATLAHARGGAAVRLRTEAFRHEVLDSPEMMTAAEAASFIRTSRQYVHQLHKNGDLIGLMHPARQRGLQFPKWQFQPGVAGKPLRKVLATLRGLDDWDKWLFFVTPDEYLCELTPLQVLIREAGPGTLSEPAKQLLRANADERLARVVTAATGYVND